MVGAERKSLSGLDESARETKICPDCGDLMPYYSRICPFCHYRNSDERSVQFDHTSSPALMFRDIAAYSKKIVMLRQPSLLEGVARRLLAWDIEPDRDELLELEATFWVIYDSLTCGIFISDQSVLESAESVRMIVEVALHERVEKERTIERFTTYTIVLSALIIVVVFALNLLCV